ncbi:uncharacterized protein LOC127280643 isoform X2 [Leptopilina boulardi]|uniref:uncharacterized protein LOC127280643 isoform X2 n=1 Tax=Leptopilina boulardi TaxID=63433 RepID=UPI0021F63189|nr:uncharacterized protein LOC127280643 isoform X2 [Leptopilina boulardi]
MSRDKIHGKSYNFPENTNCTPRYHNVFKDVTSFPYYEKKYSLNDEKLRQDYLLKKLKNLKPKDNKKLTIDNDCASNFHLENEGSKKKLHKRNQVIPVNGEKAHEKKQDFHNRETTKVCEQLNESSRLSKKMHRNGYDNCSQGKHYSKGFFKKFPYNSSVTSLEAMNSCSSFDVPVYRIKKNQQQTKLSCNKYKNKNKKNTNKIRGNNNRKCNKFSSTSLVVNYSPESDFDSYQDKHKITDLIGGNNERNTNICQCSSESDYSKEDKIPDKNYEISRSTKTNNCCCSEEEKKIKATYSYHCRYPEYQEKDNQETYANFHPKYYATPFNKKKKANFFDNNGKKYQNYMNEKKKIKPIRTSDINLSDLTPDVPLPSHWSQCGQHMTNVANEYRDLLNNFKTIQSIAVNPCRKKLKKKFTRTYPSGKEFTFEVKPAKDSVTFCKGYNNLIKRYACKKSDEEIFSKKSKKKFNKISHCICDGKKGDDEKIYKKENQNLTNLKGEKIKSVCENLTLKNENLKHDGDKLNKCQELNAKNQELNKFNFPRIVKPRGVFCRDNLRKIFICPPHGEEGSPLVLNKKCSNIDCRIKGDNLKGFRYKVTYKQEFLSPVWYPEEKGSPFRKRENTTENG